MFELGVRLQNVATESTDSTERHGISSELLSDGSWCAAESFRGFRVIPRLSSSNLREQQILRRHAPQDDKLLRSAPQDDKALLLQRSGGRVIRSPSKPSAMPKGMLSAAIRTASATDAAENGRGARYRLIAAARMAAMHPRTNPKRPAAFCRVLISAARSFGDSGFRRWGSTPRKLIHDGRRSCVTDARRCVFELQFSEP